MSDVELFPGTKLSPKVMLHQALERTGDAKSVLIITMDAGDGVDIAMSCMSLADLAFMTLKLQLYAADMLRGDGPEGSRIFAPETPT